MSVQQMIAYQTIMMVKKTTMTSKPKYLSMKLKQKQNKYMFRNDESGQLQVIKYNLSQSREGFIYRGFSLFNSLNPELRKDDNLMSFKKALRIWILENIKIK